MLPRALHAAAHHTVTHNTCTAAATAYRCDAWLPAGICLQSHLPALPPLRNAVALTPRLRTAATTRRRCYFMVTPSRYLPPFIHNLTVAYDRLYLPRRAAVNACHARYLLPCLPSFAIVPPVCSTAFCVTIALPR